MIIVDVKDISIEISCSLHIIRLLCCLIECVLCQRYLLWFCCSKTRFPFPDHILLLTDSASNLIGIYYRTNVTKINIPRSDKNRVNNYYIRQKKSMSNQFVRVIFQPRLLSVDQWRWRRLIQKQWTWYMVGL